ncbi:response regulator [candidate division KSB3 bacterium]|uniref:histidine kinase n=1 Tax=candidate division KSB3 bacterium TaxID=2044937 RepID=A0A9D5Q4B1_9BACT|nr:response regulator [candidate division KSB3 bacterium]MBD3323007.1 response regulator [candidate division KSB3 bacterium]
MTRLNFRQRQFLTLLTVGVIPLIIVVAIGLPYSRNAVIRQMTSRLEIVADLQTIQVQRWLNQGHRAARLISTSQQVHTYLEELMTPADRERVAQRHAELQARLRTVMTIFPSVRMISILHPTSGRVLFSTDPTQTGRERRTEDYFVRGRQHLYVSPVFYSVGQESPILTISAPIRELEHGALLGVIAVQMNLENLDSALANLADVHDTGRIYLVEAVYGFYVTLPSDVQGGPLRTIARSEGVRRILAGQDGTGIYPDPRGVSVLGIYRRLSDVNLGLLVEIEEAELTSRITYIWHWIMLIALFFVVMAAVAARYLTDRLVHPLEQIASAARALTAGNLAYRTPVKRSDEIGHLATAFNQMAERLQRHYENLEHLVAQRTSELAEATQQAESARTQAEAANQAKSTFLANMSHELRTPLNAILGFAGIMQHNPGLSLEEQENLAIIQRSGDHLLTLINQVLDLSKIEAGHLTLEAHDFDLHAFLEDVEDMFSLKAQDKGLRLLFTRDESVPRYVWADEIKLRQVLINLLSNALKFTDQGYIQVSLRREEDDLSEDGSASPALNLHFSVTDTGPGIAPEERESLFEAFTQTETGKLAQEGTGLGLSISRKFVRLMEGDIQVESEVGHGSTFSFVIAVKRGKPQEQHQKRAVQHVIALEPGQPRYRLLIADDKVDNRRLFVKLLAPLGFELQEAANGQEAIDTWRQWHPHLIWMDLRMPGMDGCEAAQIIRYHEASMSAGPANVAATKIIGVSASTVEEKREMVLLKACNDFLQKPFRDTQVFDLLHKHLGVRYLYGASGQPYPLSSDAAAHAFDPSSLTDLPQVVFQQLEQATITTDITQLTLLIEEIRNHNPSLAATLTALVEDFNYTPILTAIHHVKTHNEALLGDALSSDG